MGKCSIAIFLLNASKPYGSVYPGMRFTTAVRALIGAPSTAPVQLSVKLVCEWIGFDVVVCENPSPPVAESITPNGSLTEQETFWSVDCVLETVHVIDAVSPLCTSDGRAVNVTLGSVGHRQYAIELLCCIQPYPLPTYGHLVVTPQTLPELLVVLNELPSALQV